MFQLIPAIDILDGQVVRLMQGRYDEVTHYDFTPVSLAKHYVSLGATRIHLVDLNGAKDGKLTNKTIFEEIRDAVDVYLDLGGGIRTLEHADTLFKLGLNELILGSLLIKDPATAEAIISTYPGQISAGLDAHGDHIATDGWESTSSVSLKQALEKLNHLPLASVIYTDISKDGTMSGPNIDALKALIPHSVHRIIASGGVSCNDDITRLKELGHKLKGCIIGKAVLTGKITHLA
jgi:phosphoribosylformimino-5-aminoimidazole carboxamide ribotide isomerase